MKQARFETASQTMDYIAENNYVAYIRCKVNDLGDFVDYEISNKLFGEYVKFEWAKIAGYVTESYIVYADGYYISKIFE